MLPHAESLGISTPEDLKHYCRYFTAILVDIESFRRSPHILLAGFLLSLNWGLSGVFLVVPAYISSPEEIGIDNFTTISDEVDFLQLFS